MSKVKVKAKADIIIMCACHVGIRDGKDVHVLRMKKRTKHMFELYVNMIP